MPMLMMLRIGLPVNPLPRAAADLVCEGGHAIEHHMHFGHHVDAIDNDALGCGRPQGGVQHGPFFGDIDRFATEHGIDAVAQSAGLGQTDQQLNGLVGDAVFGVVEIKAGGFGG